MGSFLLRGQHCRCQQDQGGIYLQVSLVKVMVSYQLSPERALSGSVNVNFAVLINIVAVAKSHKHCLATFAKLTRIRNQRQSPRPSLREGWELTGSSSFLSAWLKQFKGKSFWHRKQSMLLICQCLTVHPAGYGENLHGSHFVDAAERCKREL